MPTSSVGSADGAPFPFSVLKFHTVKGDNVKLEKNGRLARRNDSFCKAVAFSARPILIDEVALIIV